MFRRFLIAAVLLGSAQPAAAQITTYIAPPRVTESRELLATADSVQRDSLERVSITNMTAWVDSAAGVTVPSTVGDSIDPGRPVTTFEDGSVAPNTASVLPSLMLVGVLVFGAGMVLLARRA